MVLTIVNENQMRDKKNFSSRGQYFIEVLQSVFMNESYNEILVAITYSESYQT